MSDDPVAQEQLGYFRYAVIAALLAHEPGKTLKERIEAQADRLWVFPDGRVKSIRFGTIEKWLYDYRCGGIEALQVHRRRDAGIFRGIDEELAARIDQVLREHPKLRTHAIIDHLGSRDLLGHPPPSSSTLYRTSRLLLWLVDIWLGPFFSATGCPVRFVPCSSSQVRCAVLLGRGEEAVNGGFLSCGCSSPVWASVVIWSCRRSGLACCLSASWAYLRACWILWPSSPSEMMSLRISEAM